MRYPRRLAVPDSARPDRGRLLGLDFMAGLLGRRVLSAPSGVPPAPASPMAWVSPRGGAGDICSPHCDGLT